MQETAASGKYQSYLSNNSAMVTNRWNNEAPMAKKEENATMNRSSTQNKYEINQTVKGQAVGGPKLKPKLTMWDMLTLYDTQKKRVEDEDAFHAHK